MRTLKIITPLIQGRLDTIIHKCAQKSMFNKDFLLFCGVAVQTINSYINYLILHKKIHISSWEPISEYSSQKYPKFSAGAFESAPKPTAKTSAQSSSTYRINKELGFVQKKRVVEFVSPVRILKQEWFSGLGATTA